MNRLALALVACLAAGGVSAGPLSDLILAEGVFADAPAGEVLRYRHRSADATGALVTTELRLLVLEEAGARLLLLEQEAAAARTEIARFPAASANPLLLYFLENIVRDMGRATGGNPFYIRNRIRDALISAGAAPGADGRVAVMLEPFATDPNRARLGAFAGLRLHLLFDPAQPGHLISLKADIGAGQGGYSEEMILQ